MQKISTFLWFDDNAEEAVKFYVSIFQNSKILRTSYLPAPVAKHAGGEPGPVLAMTKQMLSGTEMGPTMVDN